MKNKVRTYHGQKLINDDDLKSAMGHDVLEVNSNDELVVRNYDSKGNAEDDSYKIDLFKAIASVSKKKSLLGNIVDQIGSKKFLVSESAVQLIDAMSK